MDIWLIHGLFGCLAVFVIFPLGIIRRRVNIAPSWVSHTVIQLVGVAVALVCSAIGLLQSHGISHTHQYLGMSVIALCYGQLAGGVFLRSLDAESRAKRRLGLVHASAGVSCVAIGWWAILTGMALASWSRKTLIVVGAITAIEIAMVPLPYFWAERKANYLPVAKGPEIRL